MITGVAMRIAAFLVVVFLIAPVSGLSETINVPADYPTIQEAIDDAVTGDTIVVAPDTYVENLDFRKKGITVKSSDGPAVTVVDGNEAGFVVDFSSSSEVAVLDGFTLENGWGVYCYGSDPVIRNNIIRNNSDAGISCSHSHPLIEGNFIARNKGSGGIKCDWGSSPEIRGNVILGNEGSYMEGGGISCIESSPLIEGNRIVGNTSSSGGGIYCYPYCSSMIKDNVIIENSATSSGGGIYIEDSYPELVNNILIRNEARYGGGLACLFYSYVLTANNTFHGNSAEMEGGALYSYDAWVEVTNTIFRADTAAYGNEICLDSAHLDINYSCLEGGQAAIHYDWYSTLNWGMGMIDADPLFVDAASDDFHLFCNSPCRDAGTNAPPVSADEDIEGDPRIVNGSMDIGADEFSTRLYHWGRAVPGQSVEIKIVGKPGTLPVALFIGSGVLREPFVSPWGDWFLRPPVQGPFSLWAVPSPGGVVVLPRIIPSQLQAPCSIPMQAIVGLELTNLELLEVHLQ